MCPLPRMTAAVLVSLIATLAAACGGDDDGPAVEPPRSTPFQQVDLGPLPGRGWERHIDLRRGVAIAVPPRWQACSSAEASALVSPDRLVVITLAADRSAAGAAVEVGEFASRALAALPGYELALEPSEPRPLDSPLEGRVSEADGRSALTGIEQRVRLVAVREPGGATGLAQIAATSISESSGPLTLAMDAARTIRLFEPAPAPQALSPRDGEDERCPPPVRDPR